jgi:hypothetical protein
MFPVTQNLYVALQQFRIAPSPWAGERSVWIDAICINQDDLEERGREVKKMEMIYSKALSVQPWIGMPPVDKVSLRHFAVLGGWLEDVQFTGLEELEELHSLEDLNFDLELPKSLWLAASMIFAEPYWQRLWILQEVVVPVSIAYWYGTQRYTTGDIAKLAHYISLIWSLGNIVHPRSASCGGLDAMNRVSSRHGAISLRINKLRQVGPGNAETVTIRIVDLIALAISSQATDLRDKVYGLLALLPRDISQRMLPQITYEASCQPNDVFLMFTKAILSSKNGLNVVLRTNGYNTSAMDLPSWVLDLNPRTSHDCFPNLLWRRAILKKHEASLEKQSCIRFSADDTILFCQGSFVDEIKTTGSPSVDSRTLPDLYCIMPKFASGSPSVPKIDIKLQLARVLLWDSYYIPEDGPSPLDVPWFEPQELGDLSLLYSFPTNYRRKFDSENDLQWNVFAHYTAYRNLFRDVFHHNKDFEIGGYHFCDYFTSTERYCADPSTFENLAWQISPTLQGV